MALRVAAVAACAPILHSAFKHVPTAAAVVPNGPVRPSGPTIRTYETTTGANLSARIDSVGSSKEISFPAGTFDFSNFALSNYGLLALQTAGIRGSGRDYTTFQMVPRTSTKSGSVPLSNPPASNGRINPFRMMRVGWEQIMTPRHVSGFTLLGTDQGHLYHGIHLYYLAAGSLVENVLVKGIPGNLSREPGETMGIEAFRAAGVSGKPVHLRDVEVDGRNAAGIPVAASGFAVNFGGYLRLERTWAHHMKIAHGYALYETANVTFVQAKASNCGLNGFNFENVSGAVIMDRVEASAVGLAGTAYHLGIATNKGNAVYTITNPVIEGKAVSATNKLRVRVSGYAGGNRTQNPADIHLIVNGVERREWMTQTVTTT